MQQAGAIPQGVSPGLRLWRSANSPWQQRLLLAGILIAIFLATPEAEPSGPCRTFRQVWLIDDSVPEQMMMNRY